MENKIRKLGQTEVYKGIRVHLVRERLALPNGKETEWELILHPGASAVIPIDENGDIIMVRQYRNASDSYTLEIPAGVLDSPDEDPLVCAHRELEEETGYRSEHVNFLFKFYSCIGLCNEVIHIYTATHLIPTQQNLDDDEFVSIEKYSLNTLIEMIENGEILDNKTISSLLMYQHSKNKK